MFLTLFWLFLAVCCTPSLSAKTELPAFLQIPPAIILSKLNSTAELHCSTTLKPIGLYLKQRYSKPRELLYISILDYTKTLSTGFEHRLSVSGECCDFTLSLSQLQIEDTDGYYCEWAFMEESRQISYRQAKETVIIVRDGVQEEECNKRRMVHHLLIIISVLITVTMFIICTGLIIWKCWQSSQHYSPHKVPHRHHQPQCPHHRR